MTTVNNVWSISYPNRWGYKADCGFQYMFSNYGAFIDVIINSKQTNDIHSNFVNGAYTIDNLEIKFSGEKFKTCNFINIIMTITNKDSSDITYSICNRFDTAIDGRDNHPASGLADYRGWRGTANGRTIDFYFNNSNRVTSATSAYYQSYISPFSKENPIDDKATFSSGLTINWEYRKIKPNEVQEIRYSLGYGEYKVGYDFEVEANLTQSYEPRSNINISISITDTSIGDTIKITRLIDESNGEHIYTGKDTGSPLTIYDVFHLPSKTGLHTIKYTVTNNESISIDKSISILVNSFPNISLINDLYKVFSPNEEYSLNASIYDDTFCDFQIFIDSSKILNETISCMSSTINKTFKFRIPSGALNSKHSISIGCIDEFRSCSNIIKHEYTLNKLTPPEFNVSTISYLQTPMSVVNISGEARYPVGSISACFSSTINNKFIASHTCNDIISDWRPFSFERHIPSVLGGIYPLSVIVVDGNNRQWPVFQQFIAITVFPIKSCPVFGNRLPISIACSLVILPVIYY